MSLLNIPQKSLSNQEAEAVWQLFQTLDKYQYGFIQANDLVRLLNQYGIRVDKFQVEQMMQQCGCSVSNIINYQAFQSIISKHKQLLEKKHRQSTLDAFISVGGSEQENSSINTKQLVRIVKQQFQLTIDLQGMIREIDTDRSGKIQFEEFCNLFSK